MDDQPSSGGSSSSSSGSGSKGPTVEEVD